MAPSFSPTARSWPRAVLRRCLPSLLRSAIVPALLPFFVAACGATDRMAGGPCVAQQLVIDSTFHTYTDGGVPVATFGLHQLYASYPDGCSSNGGGLVDLVITSDAIVPIAFTYTMRGYDQNAVRDWSYDGAVGRIAPGDSILVGTVVRSRVRVDVNTRVGIGSITVVP